MPQSADPRIALMQKKSNYSADTVAKKRLKYSYILPAKNGE